MHPGRVRALNEAPARSGRDVAYVLYWMQQSQRAEHNDALEHAVSLANGLGVPLLVGFGLMDGYPDANVRHYRFMLEGLRETGAALAARGIGFVVRRGDPDRVALELAGRAAVVVCDRGYLRHQRRWRWNVAVEAPCSVVQVEADVIVPVDVASDKREFAARTLRPKLHAHVDEFLRPLPAVRLGRALDRAAVRRLGWGALDLEDLDRVLAFMRLDRSVPPVNHRHRGGPGEARARLDAFIRGGMNGYERNRPHPERASVSHMSKYLHFGQISPVAVALAAGGARRPVSEDDRASFLEELLVRRELAQNFVAFSDDYDRFPTVPEWARATLRAHARDARQPSYSPGALEAARTADPYWNAAMREMKYTGYMHNALRMYWGKQILAWSATPEQAFATALRLNNRYFLDGRDPNSYANVAWIFGLHDRPFGERKVFGKVRSMTASGLERKSDIDAYVRQVDEAVEEARAAGVRFEEDR